MSWRTVLRFFGIAPKPPELWKICPVCGGPSGDYQSKRSREAYGPNRYMCFKCAWGMFFATVDVITSASPAANPTRPTQSQPYR